jgi:hypothetical protein
MSQAIATAFERQIGWCDAADSPFTARLLEAALADWHAGGALRELLPSWPGDPGVDVVPLRVAGALHAMALDGSDPALAALYPPQREHFDPLRGPAAVRSALRSQRDRVADYLRVAPQTNEIGRSAVLLGGFAEVARRTGLPLATLEIGASAGLNQLWHRMRYELAAAQWGDAASPVTVRSRWQGALPSLPARIEIASQAACDLSPIDLAQPGAALRLMSYVWADQRERLERLRAAIALAQAEGIRVEAADALAWVRRKLAAPQPGRTTVLYHSMMWQYMPGDTRAALREAIADAGRRATDAAPLAWLSLEPPDAGVVFELRLTLWPGGQSRVLATSHPHGREATWGERAIAPDP